MKCSNCGAEIKGGKFCEFCGAQISSDMLKEQERLNKQGCPLCGSSNVAFQRENQGEIHGKNKKVVVHKTIGLCNDCGHTWTTPEASKKRKTWLWVLGWIFILPLPLTLILIKNKKMKPVLKYGLIAAAWILYLVFALSGNTSDRSVDEQSDVPSTVSIIQQDSFTEDYAAFGDSSSIDSIQETSQTAPSEAETTTKPSTTKPTTTATATTTASTTTQPTTTVPATTTTTTTTKPTTAFIVPTTTKSPTTVMQQTAVYYVLNTNTMKIHYPSCSSVKDIFPGNYAETNDFNAAVQDGYQPCKKCHPH